MNSVVNMHEPEQIPSAQCSIQYNSNKKITSQEYDSSAKITLNNLDAIRSIDRCNINADYKMSTQNDSSVVSGSGFSENSERITIKIDSLNQRSFICGVSFDNNDVRFIYNRATKEYGIFNTYTGKYYTYKINGKDISVYSINY